VALNLCDINLACRADRDRVGLKRLSGKP